MLIFAVGLAFLAASLFYPALGWRRIARRRWLAVTTIIILLSPLVIPSHHPFGRLLAAVMAVALFVKVYDLNVGADRGHYPRFASVLFFLPNLSAVVLRKLDSEPQPSRREVVRHILHSVVTCALAIPLFVVVFRIDWHRWPFALEHSVKVLTFFLVLLPGVKLAVSVWRLLGGKAREPMDHPFLACTPVDFWRRYNRPAQQFFLEDIFKPLGGKRALYRAGLATFAFSALVHEYLFVVAIEAVQGYQTAFFLIQGIAVLATARIKPKGWQVVPWWAGTFSFNLATSVLFFASINQVLPFYVARETSGPSRREGSHHTAKP